MANDWQNKPLNSSGYRDGMDYSLAIRNATSDAEVQQLQAERKNKIDTEYGGSDPYKNVNTSSSYGSNWNPQTTTAAGSAAYRGVQNTVNSGGTASSEQITASNATWANPTGLAAVNANTAPVTGMASVYDQSIMSAADAERIVQLSQLAKEAYASGNPNAVYHQEAEAIRAKYGYSGGDMGDEYIPLKKEVDVPKVQPAETVSTDRWGDYLDQWLSSAQQQQTNQIDYATNQAIQDLIRQQQDAQATYQSQQNQIAIDEAKAKDNQALYAEARGDKGGIGAAQYDAIMNTAAQNRLQVSQAQQKLATDTARQIADLRAQGEYEKADALLQLSQTYLSQLISMEQWALEYNLSVAQFNASLQQWEAEFKMAEAGITGSYNGRPTLQYQQYQDELALTQQNQLASAGETLLSAGIMPSASQLSAMGITQEQAQSYITAYELSKKSSPTNPVNPINDPSGSGILELFEAARDQGDPDIAWSWIRDNYKKFGLTTLPDKTDFTNWRNNNMRWEDLDTDAITNTVGKTGQAIMIERPDGSETMVNMASAENMYKDGTIRAKYDSETKKYTLVFTS